MNLLVTLLLCWQAATTQPADRFPELLELLLGDDPTLVEDAESRFIERYAADALAAAEALPALTFAQRQRLEQTFEQAEAEVRWRLLRRTLPAGDRALADRFAEAYPQLVRRLFHRTPGERLEALDRIPLVPDSGAGVLLALKAEDPSPEVALRALAIARGLADEVVARGMHRYLRQIMDLVESGYFKDKHPDVELVVGQYAHAAIGVLGATGDDSATPTIVAAIRHFTRRYDTHMWSMAEVLDALGRIGDRRAVEVILPYLKEQGVILRNGTTTDGRRLLYTNADAALVALLRIYGQPPADFGLLEERNGSFLGFETPEARAEGVQRFRLWRSEHAATQPAP